MLDFSPYDFNATGHKDLDHATPMLCAANEGNYEVVKMLIEASENTRVDLNIQREDCLVKPTPLHAACFNGHVETVRLMLDNADEYGISLTACGKFKYLPLHSAISMNKGRSDMFDRSDPLVLNEEPKVSPFFLGEPWLVTVDWYLKKIEVVSLLLKHPVARRNTNYNAVSDRSDCGFTPLHIASFDNSPEMVKLLLDNAKTLNVDVSIRNSTGHTPFQFAKAFGSEELCRLFSDYLIDNT